MRIYHYSASTSNEASQSNSLQIQLTYYHIFHLVENRMAVAIINFKNKYCKEIENR